MKFKKIIVVGDKSMAEVPEDLSAAFVKLGYEATYLHFFYSRLIHRIAWGFINTPFKFSRKIGDYIVRLISLDINRKFVSSILMDKPDLVVVVNGFSLSENSLCLLKKNNIKIFNWVLDDPSRARFSHFIGTSSIYDAIFCCSKNWLNYVKLWNNNLYYLPLAVNPDKYKKVSPSDKAPDFDLAFIGTFNTNDSSSYFRYFFLDYLSKYNYKIRVAGNNVVNYFKGIKGNYILSNKLPLADVLNIYRNTRIIFNPYNTYNQDVISLRVFEVASMGVFQVVPFQGELVELFKDQIVFFEKLEDLAKKVSYYLLNSSERQKMADLLYTEVLKNHTYLNRAETILSSIPQ